MFCKFTRWLCNVLIYTLAATITQLAAHLTHFLRSFAYRWI